MKLPYWFPKMLYIFSLTQQWCNKSCQVLFPEEGTQDSVSLTSAAAVCCWLFPCCLGFPLTLSSDWMHSWVGSCPEVATPCISLSPRYFLNFIMLITEFNHQICSLWYSSPHPQLYILHLSFPYLFLFNEDLLKTFTNNHLRGVSQ